MIRSFADKDTERFAAGNSIRRFRAFERVAYRKIKYLQAAKEERKHEMKMKAVHPGEVLVEDFLKPMGISQYRLAKDIHVPLRRINEIALCRRGITADTALRLARYFGTTPEVWQNLQSQYEIDSVSESLWKKIVDTITPHLPKAACFA